MPFTLGSGSRCPQGGGACARDEPVRSTGSRCPLEQCTASQAPPAPPSMPGPGCWRGHTPHATPTEEGVPHGPARPALTGRCTGPGHYAWRWPWLRGCRLPVRSLTTPCSVPTPVAGPRPHSGLSAASLPSSGPVALDMPMPSCLPQGLRTAVPAAQSASVTMSPSFSPPGLKPTFGGGGGHLLSQCRPPRPASLICAHLSSPKAPPPVLVCHLPGQQDGVDKDSVCAGPGHVWACECLVLST